MDGIVEDVTDEILQGNKDKVAELIQKVEGKTLQDISSQEIIQLVGYVKVLHSDVMKLQNQNRDLLTNLNTFYRANQEMAGIARDVSASVVGNDEKVERVTQIVQQYTTDTAVGFVKFSLDGEEVQMTRNKLRQIISWYKKGYVYFEKGQPYNIVSINGSHSYSFGELVVFTERENPEEQRECIVTGETPWLVDVLFLKDFDVSENYITPSHVLKSRISKMNEKRVIVDKQKLMTFMTEVNYINYCHDETKE